MFHRNSRDKKRRGCPAQATEQMLQGGGEEVMEVGENGLESESCSVRLQHRSHVQRS